MSRGRSSGWRHGRIATLVYFITIVLSFYLLFESRSGEVHTVWEVIHPLFMPMFFSATFMLFIVIFSSEKAEHKLLLTIIHSILCHAFFVIILPAGNVGPQQEFLGQTRLVFDGVFTYGYNPAGNILTQIYHWCRENLQLSITVILTRVFAADLYSVHLLLIPVLWGIFVPITTFMFSQALLGNRDVSVLSSLLVSAFSSTILWGAASIPMGLGYTLLFFSMYVLLRYLRSGGVKEHFLMIISCIASFLAHFLAGILSFSVLLLATALKSYKGAKEESPLTAKISLFLSIIFCASILPLALVFHKFFYPIYTYFSLEKLYELSQTEIVASLLLGGYVSFDLFTALVLLIGPTIGFLGMIYTLKRGIKKTSNSNDHVCTLFLFIAFLIILADDRIINLFMINVPLGEPDRLWPIRNFIAAPFAALAVTRITNYLHKRISSYPQTREKLGFLKSQRIQASINLKHTTAHLTILILLSTWVTASVYYAYPHYGPLQTTTYELEAVKCIHETAHAHNQTYIVICDLWITYAGGMIAGIDNPRAFYFPNRSSEGVALFLEMKKNPKNETMIKAMKTNNATTAYFIIEKPRLDAEEYNRIKSQAQQNKLQIHQTFSYKGEEKLTIFYYEKPSSTE